MPRAPPTAQRFVFPELPKASIHGKRIYVFRNLQTQQIIYSFYNGIQMQHIRLQLPFIGKHSVPAAVRRDLWTPHCVVTFPTGRQGEHAFKLLREFRKLHELQWNKHNPEWRAELTKKQLIKKIMDQRANMTADLQKVLQIQAKIGKREARESEKHSELVQNIESRRWKEIEELAALVDKGEVDDLEAKIQVLQQELTTAESTVDKSRISNKMTEQRRRIRKLLWAKNEIEAREARIERERADAQQKEDDAHARLVAEHDLQLARIEEWKREPIKTGPRPPNPDPIPPKRTVGSLDPSENPYLKSVLPKTLATPLPEPFAVEGAVEIDWADIIDAESAGPWYPKRIEDQSPWPGIQIGTLPTVAKAHSFVTEDEFNQQLEQEWEAIKEAEREAEIEQLRRAEEEAEKSRGLKKYLPNWS